MNEREILDQLVVERKITEEDIAGASSRVLTFDMEELIDMLHTRCCELNHDTDECGWYREMGPYGENEWKGPYHFAWTESFRNFLASTKLIQFIPKSVTEEPSSSADGSSLPG